VKIEREDEMIFFIPENGRGLTMYTPGPRFAWLIEKLLQSASQKDLDYLFEDEDE